MSAFPFYATPTSAPPIAHHGHHNHSTRRRGGPPKLAMHSGAQKSHQHAQQLLRSQVARPARAPTPELINLSRYMDSLEQWCSLDFDDDVEFIPNLLSASDIISHSSGSERSSTVSSPEASPTQLPQQVATGFLNSAFNPVMMPPEFQSRQSFPIHQPLATRAIAIIDPSTGVPVSSPSPSASPHRIPHTINRW